MTNEIVVGFEINSGEQVSIAPNHLFIGGTTGTGKSELMRALIDRYNGKVLILDVKRPRDYADFVADVPLYVEKQMEPLQIKRLIESTEHLSIKKELPELIRIAEVSKSWEEMLNFAREKIEGKIRPYTKDILQLLIHLFARLVKELEEYHFSGKVELPQKVNVMNISELSDQLQQIVVASVLRYILKKRKDVVVVIDEAHRFIPEGMRSGSSENVIRFIREGRANRLWLWMADQTVTGVDKGLLKQMQVWILGRQPEINEAERTLKQIPQRKALKLNIEAVQTLGLGEFIVTTPKSARHIYAWPTWVEEWVAVQVALGNNTAEKVSATYKPDFKEDDDMWKEKYEKETKRALDAESALEKAESKIKAFKDQLGDFKKKLDQQDLLIEELKGILNAREKELMEITGELGPLDIPVSDEPPIDISEGSPLPEPEKGRAVVFPIPRDDIYSLIDERVKQLALGERPIVTVSVGKALRAKISGAWMESFESKLANLKDPARQSARFIHAKGTVSFQDLLYHIRHRKGKPDGAFNRDYLKPLEDLDIIEKTGGGGKPMVIHWKLEEQILEQFKGVLNDDEIRELKEWLLSFIL